MPGFLVSNLENKVELHNVATYCYKNEMSCGLYWAKWNTLNKYMQDKLFYQNDKYVLILEGIILNKDELCAKYAADFEGVIIKMYESLGDEFMKELRGSFAGAVYDKTADRWLLYTDQTATKPLYYYIDADGKFACGTQLNYVTDTMKENDIRREADEHGLSCLLVYGNFMDECTGVLDVNRLFPGDYLVIHGKDYETKTYHQIGPQKREGLSLNEYIEMLDTSFKNAVRRIINKDREYGYKTVIDISGGVDSRMIAYTAKAVGCENAITITYSQSGGREIKIAQEVANNLGYNFYFKALDNGSCLYDLDENVLMNNGSAIYLGITGGKDFLQLLNPADYGVEMTGLLGDIYDGSMVIMDGEEKPYLEYSKFRFGSVLPYDEQTYSNVLNRFENHELFWYYIRGMICGMSSFPIRQNFVEPMTPFGDVEFMEAYLSIPWAVRVKNKLLSKWMTEKYPEAAQIMYAATGVTIADEFTFLGKMKKMLKFVNQEVHRQLRIMHKGYQMTPFDYWTKQYPGIVKFMKEYYRANIDRTSGEMREKIEKLMEEKSPVIDKALALTALAYYKHFLD